MAKDIKDIVRTMCATITTHTRDTDFSFAVSVNDADTIFRFYCFHMEDGKMRRKPNCSYVELRRSDKNDTFIEMGFGKDFDRDVENDTEIPGMAYGEPAYDHAAIDIIQFLQTGVYPTEPKAAN
jgi:hypothetical protein